MISSSLKSDITSHSKKPINITYIYIYIYMHKRALAHKVNGGRKCALVVGSVCLP